MALVCAIIDGLLAGEPEAQAANPAEDEKSERQST
jgi:hypothetical protein